MTLEMTLEKIKKTIKEHNMITPGDGVIVGLSGGPDSMCLVHALVMLKDELGVRDICAVHINHGLRGAESDGDEAYVKEQAAKLGITFVSFNYDVKREAEKLGLGTEDAGRKLRYEAFEKVRRERGAQRIAVAHNQNDQAETVLMRIMRGTGIAGLAGIPYTRDDGVIIRPVLDLSRGEIEAYCRENGISPRIDSTNDEPVYTRNKIRLNLLPMMQQEFNPNVVGALVRLARQAAEDEDCIMQEALAYLDGKGEQQACAKEGETTENSQGSGAREGGESLHTGDAREGQGGAKAPLRAGGEGCSRLTDGAHWEQGKRALDLQGFEELHGAVARRVLMVCAKRAGVWQGLGAVHVAGLLKIASARGKAMQADLTEGFYAESSYGKLYFIERKKSGARAAKNAAGAGTETIESTSSARAAKNAAGAGTEITDNASDASLASAAAGNRVQSATDSERTVSAREGVSATCSSDALRCARSATCAVDTFIDDALALPYEALERKGEACVDAGTFTIRLTLTSTASGIHQDRPEGHTGTASGTESGRPADQTCTASGIHQDRPEGHAGSAPGHPEDFFAVPQQSKRISIDYDALLEQGPAVFRNRRPGDRFRPRGMQAGSKKLQDYFTDRKIPKPERDSMVLLVCAGRVMVAGGEVSDECAIKKPQPKTAESFGNIGTRRILTIEY